MKTDRSSLTRAAAVLLAGLLLVDLSVAGQTFTFGRSKRRLNPAAVLAGALALQVGVVQEKFGRNRRALHTVQLLGGQPAYPRQEVAGLIAHTGEDLDQAIAAGRPSGMEPLRAWSAEEIGRIQAELAAAGQKTAAAPSVLSTPRAIARVASREGFPALRLAQAAAPQQDAVAADQANRLLDEMGKVIGKIFFLASHNDLEVKLWVGSTVPHAMFSFWSQGKIKGTSPAPTIIRTDGKRGGVLRGLYVYKATWTQGEVTQVIEYPQPAGTQATPSERLDLVNGSGFFCCRFDEHYCHAVAKPKECR
jgi:hypothetical protein